MKIHSAFKDTTIAVAVLDVLIQHTLYTLFQAMMFMSNESNDKLVEKIANHRDTMKKARLPDIKEKPCT